MVEVTSAVTLTSGNRYAPQGAVPTKSGMARLARTSTPRPSVLTSVLATPPPHKRLNFHREIPFFATKFSQLFFIVAAVEASKRNRPCLRFGTPKSLVN